MKISMSELRNLILSEVKRNISEQSDIDWSSWDSLKDEYNEDMSSMTEQSSSDDIDWSSWDSLDEDDYDMYEYDFMSEDSKKDGFVPPQSVAKTAERALKWREEHGRGGTEVGVARARDLKNRKSLSKETINRMKSYFARHAVDKKAPGFHSETDPSAGRIAWDLWGGDAGAKWARGIKDLDESLPILNLDWEFDDVDLIPDDEYDANVESYYKETHPEESRPVYYSGDDDWRREQAMQAGMGMGIDAYNDEMGWDLNRGR